ncbi:DUF1206 domain-containing protein [Brevundimonas sp. NIBR11]|uniref:DUF1206 domain-containing protein n=1 Tax=Brevundimonas sp. NIBR11 TaxID=3015999 RepID=UPI0022F1440D|nr:DUF1206 domain-containing protein [Brevundimonas sp. NIBR11]WGM29995.1 hypothetical protein KKHFBJBL_00210 [Brevundimonas sp. NIBR11]
MTAALPAFAERLIDRVRKRRTWRDRFPRVHEALEASSRFGHAANGFVYVSVGILMLASAIGMRGQAVDPHGVLYVLAQQPFGRLWLILIGAGLWAFVGWRVLQAVFDIDHEGSDLNGWAVRATQATSGAAYAVLASGVFELLDEVQANMGAEQLAENQEKAAILLGLPFGGAVLMVIGLIIAGVGIGNIVMGFVNDFAATLVCSKTVCRWVLPLARVGYVARGLAYLPLALFVTLAGYRASSDRVETFGTALEALERQPGGAIMLGMTAVGLIAFGAYAFVEARFRRIRVPKDLEAG